MYFRPRCQTHVPFNMDDDDACVECRDEMPDGRFGIVVSTWRGSNAWALHYYAHPWRVVETEDGEETTREQALHAMTTEEARRLNDHDGTLEKGIGNPYREGDLTWRFADRTQAIGAALCDILRWTGGVRVPVGLGETWYVEPDEWIDWNAYEALNLVPRDGTPPPEAPKDPRLEVHDRLQAPAPRRSRTRDPNPQGNPQPTFAERYRTGDATLDDVGDYVSRWRQEKDGGTSLGDYLGLSQAQYAAWLRDPDALGPLLDREKAV